jgi:hypothetical protein
LVRCGAYILVVVSGVLSSIAFFHDPQIVHHPRGHQLDLLAEGVNHILDRRECGRIGRGRGLAR